MDIQVSGHGNRPDIIWMLKKINPDYFLPVYGFHYMLKEAAKLAESLGFKKDKILSFEIADESSLISQIQHADILYLMGGVSLKLLETLKPFDNLRQVLEGKIIVGESAGANVLSSYFYTPSADQVSPGLGFVPVKTIPHYVDEYAGKLDNVAENIPLLKLKEYEFKVFEI
jgi:peptidase E